MPSTSAPSSFKLRAWTYRFAGLYPVGACGVVTATSPAEAVALAREKVVQLGCDPESIGPLEEVNLRKPNSRIIMTGDY